MTRRWDIDALRGLMLVLMTLTHLPTRLTVPAGQPFGFVSAAEGFVLLSAFMAGMVYSRLAATRGVDAMRTAFLHRAVKLYGCHAATLVFLFTVIAAVGIQIDQPAVKNLMTFYLAEPLTSLVTGLLLVYEPPLLDILPIYILFMLASPWVITHALRRGWAGVMAVSIALWVLAQFGLGRWVYDATVALTGLTVPFHETGSFATFAWQFLWMLGLWIGTSYTQTQDRLLRFPHWAVVLASGVALLCFVWRHAAGQSPFGPSADLNMLFDKWQLAPLRLLNLLALVLVTIHFGPALRRHLPRMPWLETLGAASLPVFFAHLLLVLLVLALWGIDPWMHPWWVDALLLLVCFGVLSVVARISLWVDRSAAHADHSGNTKECAANAARTKATCRSLQ